MNRSFILFFLLVASTAFGKINVTASGFTAAQEKLVRSAATLAIQRMVSEKVVLCAVKYAKRSRTLDSDDEWKFKNKEDREGHVAFALLALQTAGFDIDDNKSHKINLTITAANLGGSVTGRAKVGIVRDDKRKFSIELDKAKVGGNGHLATSEFWAETISHEMLHNITMRHGTSTGATWETNYEGFVITEWGYCVESNGANGSSSGLGLVGGRPRYNN